MISKFPFPPRSQVVSINGVKWSHRLLRPGTQLDPLATKIVHIVSGKNTCVLGVMNGLPFQQWWQRLKTFREKTQGSSIQTDFPDVWQNAEAAIIHIEDNAVARFGKQNGVPDRRKNIIVPRGLRLTVTIEVVGKRDSQLFELSGDVAIRADHLVLALDDCLDAETGEDLGSHFLEIAKFIHTDQTGFAKAMLLLEDSERPGILKLAVGQHGSTCRLLQNDIAEHVSYVDKLYADFWDNPDVD